MPDPGTPPIRARRRRRTAGDTDLPWQLLVATADRLDEALLIASPELGAVRYANIAVERVFGISPEVLRRAPRSLLSAVHPDDQTGVHALLDAASNSSEVSVRFARGDGTIRMVRLRIARTRDAAGAVAIIASDDTMRTGLARLADGVAAGAATLERSLRELAATDPASPEDHVESAVLSDGDGTTDRSAFYRRLGTLSPRERQVLELLAADRSTAQIASALGIHRSTVGVHRAALLRKLGVKSIVAALRLLVFSGGSRRSL